jgi:hypothetical protein
MYIPENADEETKELADALEVFYDVDYDRLD